MSQPLRDTMTTGQLSCYRTGQIIDSAINYFIAED
jgi:hypothetical protein